MAIAPTGLTVASSAKLGVSAPGAAMKSYYVGSPGNKIGGVDAGCIEALASSGAVSWDPQTKTCYGVQGTRIIIGDTFESIHSGFELVNFNFHCSGTQASVASELQLGGPVLS